MADEVEKQLEEIEAMFAQSARSMRTEGDRTTFEGLSASTLYFSDRPQRVVGHLTAQHFVDLWDEGENSFADDPPNAVIAFLEEGEEAPEDAIVVLEDPVLDGDRLSYKVTVLEGSLPAAAESCSIFIDPFGRPLSPGSVAGVHRRRRRRAVRRF